MIVRIWVRLHSFSANHFKNWLFLGLACGKSTRMTAKLRPLWGVKQRRQSVRVNFPRARPRNSTIFSQVCGKRMQPNPAPQKPDVRVWGTRCHRRGRRNGICGGLSSNPLRLSAPASCGTCKTVGKPFYTRKQLPPTNSRRIELFGRFSLLTPRKYSRNFSSRLASKYSGSSLSIPYRRGSANCFSTASS